MTKDARGFTLIELLIVVAIIGIIAAIAVPNLLTAIDKARQKATMADIRQVAQALDAYMLENGDYPSAATITDLASILEPNYLRDVPEQDRWKNAFTVVSEPGGYTICSNGKDGEGQCETEALGLTSSFNDAITFSDGMFVTQPAGAQSQ